MSRCVCGHARSQHPENGRCDYHGYACHCLKYKRVPKMNAPQTVPHFDKRTVSTDALDTLGMIHTKQEKRDAIHLAVEPVTAAEALKPGQHIVVDPAGNAYGVPPGHGLGIVDPFITGDILPGAKFWFVMYPRQVHSLRHVWSHPAFVDE